MGRYLAVCGMAMMAASCTPEAVRPARLEFRLVPTREQIKPEDAGAYRKLLAAGRVGTAHPEKRYAWAPTALPEQAGARGLFTGVHEGRRYMLVDGGLFGMMVPDGTMAWGLAKVAATTDESGAPAVAFDLDEPGTLQFAMMTQYAQQWHVAILVDGEVVAAPVVKTVLGRRGMIAGHFTRAQAERMAAALAAGMPPRTIPDARQWAATLEELNGRTREALRRSRTVMEFRGQELAEVVDELREKTGVNFHINWRALAAMEVDPKTPVTLKAAGPVTAEAALQRILLNLSGEGKKLAAYRIEGGVVVISTQKQLGASARRPVFLGCGTDTASQAALMKVRCLPMRMDFDGQELDFVTDYLHEVCEIPIQVKWEELEKAAVEKRTSVVIRLKQVVPEQFLQCLLEDLSAVVGTRVGYAIREGKITISTAADLLGKEGEADEEGGG